MWLFKAKTNLETPSSSCSTDRTKPQNTSSTISYATYHSTMRLKQFCNFLDTEFVNNETKLLFHSYSYYELPVFKVSVDKCFKNSF